MVYPELSILNSVNRVVRMVSLSSARLFLKITAESINDSIFLFYQIWPLVDAFLGEQGRMKFVRYVLTCLPPVAALLLSCLIPSVLLHVSSGTS